MARFFLFLAFVEVNSIISPPNEIIETSVEVFNQWKETRNAFMDSMEYPMGFPNFNCPQPHRKSSESVHQLHPSQIGVIAALGDSVSVAQAAKSSSILDLFDQFPGVSFVTGDDVKLNEQATFINIFRKFAPRIKGGSSDFVQKFYDFNMAIPGSFSSELPEQALKLASTLKKKLGRETSDTWKFVNIFIGHNDLCNICNNETTFGPETFGKSLHSALTIIQTNVPKVFVNIMPPINVKIHSQAHKLSKFCEFSHRKTCSCIFELNEKEYQNIKKQFDEQLNEVVEQFNQKYGNSSTFAVVIAPAMDLKSIPLLKNQPNIGLLALDCFHLSPIAHDIAAKQIWKGLFEPIDQKTITNQLSVGFDRFVCPPVECPYLRTIQNSENCEPSREMRFLRVPSAFASSPGLSMPPYMIPVFFLFGTALILLFVRASIRSSTTSSEFSDERHHLLLPLRADLNDNIF